MIEPASHIELALFPGVVGRRSGRRLSLGGPRQRAVLALLAVRVGEPVSLDSLIDGVWGEAPPPSARKSMRAYLSRLRSVLGAEHLRSAAGGYVLDLPPGAVDVAVFRRRVAEARRVAAGDESTAISSLRAALDDAAPVASCDFAECPGARAVLEGIEQERLAALELLMELEVARGSGPGVVERLERLVGEHPYRERLWASLMRALYQSGRHVDALGAYQRVRRALDEELGLEPGPQLRELEQAILRHDAPALGAVPVVPRHLTTGPDPAVHRPPDTRYARTSDGVHVAYQVVGSGPVDVVLFGPPISHVELAWAQPEIATFYGHLAAFSRLIVFDKRGVGMSDPVVGAPDLAQRSEDVLAVMDAVGSERAVMLGTSDGGLLGVHLACTRPERVAGLALYSTFACQRRLPDHPIGVPDELFASFLDLVERDWGGPDFVGLVVPSFAGDTERVARFGRFARHATSPGGAVDQFVRNRDEDVRHLLPRVPVPVLVMHAVGERFVRVDHSRHLARHLPDARLVEMPGRDHLPYGDNAARIVEEVREFVAA